MRILFASDHAGFSLKNELVSFARELGYEVEDLGPAELVEEDDYTDTIAPLARLISANPEERGVIVGGSGQGEAMVANRFPNVRAAVFYGGPLELVRLSREHNNANILSFGARFLHADEAREAMKLWLDTHFSGEERHARRIQKLEGLRS